MTTPIAPTIPNRAASQARIDANRRNAQKSTGPKTDEGKRRARLNALKHGLASKVVDLEADAARSKARAEALRSIHQPDQPWGHFACEQAARASVMIERAASMIDFAAEEAAVDAESVDRWAEGRRAEVARLAGRIDRNPGPAVSSLAECPYGIDWLIGQWQLLRASAEKGDGWDPDQGYLALDLLRFDRRQRHIRPEGAYALIYTDEPVPESLGDLCRRMIARLVEQRGPAAEADEARRLAAAAGVSDRHAAEVRKLRRYEASLHRRVEGLLRLLQAPNPPAAEKSAGDEMASAAGPKPEAEIRPNEPRLARPNEPKPAEPDDEERPEADVRPNRNLPTPPSSRKDRPDPARLLREAKRQRRRCA